MVESSSRSVLTPRHRFSSFTGPHGRGRLDCHPRGGKDLHQGGKEVTHRWRRRST